ncbi:acyl-CoA thioesterase [Alkaliphilus crotonatoxidans]
MKGTSEITVRYAETDQMGVVYHGNYFTWFEIGRTTLLKELGYSYRDMENQGIMLPVVDAACQYKEAAKYDDEILIETSIKALKRASITFFYELLRKEDGVLLARGTTTHAFVDKERFKAVSLKKLNPDLYDRLGQEIPNKR